MLCLPPSSLTYATYFPSNEIAASTTFPPIPNRSCETCVGVIGFCLKNNNQAVTPAASSTASAMSDQRFQLCRGMIAVARGVASACVSSNDKRNDRELDIVNSSVARSDASSVAD